MEMITPGNTFTVTGFAARLAEKMKQKGLNQNRLALALGVSRSTVTGWISHHKLPDAVILAKICAELACSADWLLGLSSHFEKEAADGRIKWIEQIPPYLSGFQQEQIEHGIRSFRTLIAENQPATAITGQGFKNHSWQYLHLAFKAALRSGAIRLTHVARSESLEVQLKRYYPALRDVIVADVPAKYDGTLMRAELVAFLAATEVLNKVIREGAIGLGSGYTMVRLCEQSIPSADQFNGTRWVPLMAFAENNSSSYSANYLARFMAARHPGSTALYLPHPRECTSAAMQAAEQETRNMMANVLTVFASVNGVDRRDRAGNPSIFTEFRTADYIVESPHLRRKYQALPNKAEFGGELLGQMLDTSGRVISPDHEVTTQVDLDLLRYASQMVGKVCLVAARQYKAKPVLTCLKNGLANALVIDTEIAEYLLENG